MKIECKVTKTEGETIFTVETDEEPVVSKEGIPYMRFTDRRCIEFIHYFVLTSEEALSELSTVIEKHIQDLQRKEEG